MRPRLSFALFIVLAVLGAPAGAAFPTAYAPLTVEPLRKDGQLDFDLRPAQQRARQLGKSLYVYLGARDCAYCRRYETFLEANAKALVPHFAKDYLVVDLRSDLSVTAEQIVLRTETLHLPYLAFQKAIGDARTRAIMYPNVWLLTADGKALMQMPSGAGTFETVAEQLEILQLVQ